MFSLLDIGFAEKTGPGIKPGPVSVSILVFWDTASPNQRRLFLEAGIPASAEAFPQFGPGIAPSARRRETAFGLKAGFFNAIQS